MQAIYPLASDEMMTSTVQTETGLETPMKQLSIDSNYFSPAISQDASINTEHETHRNPFEVDTVIEFLNIIDLEASMKLMRIDSSYFSPAIAQDASNSTEHDSHRNPFEANYLNCSQTYNKEQVTSIEFLNITGLETPVKQLNIDSSYFSSAIAQDASIHTEHPSLETPFEASYLNCSQTNNKGQVTSIEFLNITGQETPVKELSIHSSYFSSVITQDASIHTEHEPLETPFEANYLNYSQAYNKEPVTSIEFLNIKGLGTPVKQLNIDSSYFSSAIAQNESIIREHQNPPRNPFLIDNLNQCQPSCRDIVNLTDSACPVCLKTSFRLDQMKRLRCYHIFHQSCIDKWLAMNRSCPVCRTPYKRLSRKRRHRVNKRLSCKRKHYSKRSPYVPDNIVIDPLVQNLLHSFCDHQKFHH